MIHREGGLANPRLVAIFKVESKELELVTKNRQLTRSWTARVRLVQFWPDAANLLQHKTEIFTNDNSSTDNTLSCEVFPAVLLPRYSNQFSGNHSRSGHLNHLVY